MGDASHASVEIRQGEFNIVSGDLCSIRAFAYSLAGKGKSSLAIDLARNCKRTVYRNPHLVQDKAFLQYEATGDGLHFFD